MKLSVIIVNYNVKHYLYQCLDSLRRALKGIDAEIFVVDNHSRDGSIEYLTVHFPEVNYIELSHNLGFARANNIAIERSKGEYVLLLNPDTIVCEETIKNVLTFMDEHPESGAVGVKMLNSFGEKAMESRRGIPTPMTAFYKMCGLCKRFPQSKRFAHYYMSYLPWDKPAEIEVVSGAFCMLRREALNKIGHLDENFFMYGEDIDLSFRLLNGGWKNWYIPQQILHYKGESTAKSSFRYVHVFYKAMLTFFNKHYSHLRLWFTVPVKTAIYFKAFGELVKMKIRQAGKSLGIFTPRSRQHPAYVVIGTETTCEACKALFNRKGIGAELIVGNKETLPDGHLSTSIELPESNMTYIVYDTSAYDYQTILQLFAQKPSEKIRIATYHPSQQMIVTEQEILG